MEIIREGGTKQVGGSAAASSGREVTMEVVRESGGGKLTGGSSAVSMEIVRESGGAKQTGGSSAVSMEIVRESGKGGSTAQIQVQLINKLLLFMVQLNALSF
jgi:hypothetical protein